MADQKPQIAAAMLAVARAMNLKGIGKDRESKAEGRYAYRGIDDALDNMAGPMAAAGLTVAPSYAIKDRIDYKGKGTISVVEATLTFYAEDNSSRVVGPFPGEAFDGMDKGLSKACSVAYRNAMFLTFVIPLGPGYDPEAHGDDDQGDDVKNTKAEQPVGDPGIFLKGAQLKWLEKKMEVSNVSEAAVLKQFHRVDATNAKDVGAWIDGA